MKNGKKIAKVRLYYKSCQKGNCHCRSGKAHGPYFYVYWVEDGKQRQRSLGRADDNIELPKTPTPWDYRLSQAQYDAMPKENVGIYKLTDENFLQHYGVSRSEDRFNRPVEIKVNYYAYQRAVSEYEDMAYVLRSSYSAYGVASKRAVLILEDLEKQGFVINFV